MVDAAIRWLNQVPSTAEEFIVSDAKNDGDIVDILGSIRAAEVGLADVRKRHASEIEAGTKGAAYELEQSQRAVRSYNTQSLLIKFTAAMDLPPLQVLNQLVLQGVIDLTWKWTALKKAASTYGLTLTTAHHEIEDGDPDADIGEYWKHGYPRYTAIEDE